MRPEKWLFILCLTLAGKLAAQGTGRGSSTEAIWPSGRIPSDSALELETAKNTVVVQQSVHESEVKFRKRVWRRIDLRQKMNHYFLWQGQPLTQVICEMGLKGKMKAYRTDSLGSVFTPAELKVLGDVKVKTQIKNWKNPNDPMDLIDTVYTEKFQWNKILKIEVMEDWIFDATRGEFVSKIIAIAPVMGVSKNGLTIDEPMFWIKMTDIQPEFKLHYVQTKSGATSKLSWDEVFNTYKLYDGYLVKQSSSGGGYLNGKPEYMQNGEAALIESDHLMNDLFIFEHDLWEY